MMTAVRLLSEAKFVKLCQGLENPQFLVSGVNSIVFIISLPEEHKHSPRFTSIMRNSIDQCRKSSESSDLFISLFLPLSCAWIRLGMKYIQC